MRYCSAPHLRPLISGDFDPTTPGANRCRKLAMRRRVTGGGEGEESALDGHWSVVNVGEPGACRKGPRLCLLILHLDV